MGWCGGADVHQPHYVRISDTEGYMCEGRSVPERGFVLMNKERAVIGLPSAEDDPVNHPSHYTDGKIEVSTYIRDKALNFFLGNVVKYVSRAGKKDPNKKVEDLEKARWYLNEEIVALGGSDWSPDREADKVDPNAEEHYCTQGDCILTQPHSGPCTSPIRKSKNWND